MCGIAGCIDLSGIALGDICRITALAAHRGPDGEGYWLWDGGDNPGKFFLPGQAQMSDEKGIIALGHRRLAILDLSEAGLQPMSKSGGMFWIVFNGEIYNYIELRDELIREGYAFQTGTDTEVILCAYQHWGTNCFRRFNGMWSVAIIDRQQRSIILSRDRFGIKPLYYSLWSRAFAFASEIKQLLALPNVRSKANVDSVVEYIDTGYEAPPATFFEDVQAFPAGAFAVISMDAPSKPNIVRYWKPEDISPQVRKQADLIEEVKTVLTDSVRLCLRSDVPVGVSLSGGLDSSGIYGLAHRIANGQSLNIHAFSAVFDEPRFDERKFIQLAASDKAGMLNFVSPTADEFVRDCDRFLYMHDEPPGSMSQYAAWAVMRLAREKGVPVILCGQGGDELFSGYWSAYYLFLRQHFRRRPWRALTHMTTALLPGGNPALVAELLPHLKKYRHRRDRNNRALLVPSLRTAGHSANLNWAMQAQKLDPVQYRVHEITRVHLPRLLKWDDRNSMAFSIEGRYPLLDYRFVELAVTIPPEMNLRSGWNKLVFRQALDGIIPKEIQWRRSKIGFETPQSAWLRTTMRAVLLEWCANPSERLLEFVDRNELQRFIKELLDAGSLNKMDERAVLVFRLFFLDKWLNIFSIHK